MRIENKTPFADYEIHPISGGNFLREKPVFSKNAKNLIVSNKETCHKYSATTGEHLAELFACDGPIITIQNDPADADSVLAVTEAGSIFQFNLESGDEPVKLCTLTLSSKTLSQLQVPNFATKSDLKVKPKLFNWAVLLKNVKFIYVVVKAGLAFASWSAPGELYAHASVFDSSTGIQLTEHTHPLFALQKTSENLALGNDFVLLMSSDSVLVGQLSSNTKRIHYIASKYKFTRIATHPDDALFATGDTVGRITVWRNIFEKNPLRDIHHWHTLPVRSLVFTECGSHMFSGGEENVLVKWSVSSRLKTFLPRLSSSIHHLSTAPGSALLSVSTADSRILVINLNLACLATIQHFSSWTTTGRGHTGNVLALDPRADALVLSGRTGHLQFLSDRGRFLHTFDVTQRNYITGEKYAQPGNVEVVFSRFTRCGKWLITAETGPEESRLKFWVFDSGKQEFSLNTDVDVPHGPKGIASLEVSSGELAVTTGPDCCFRLWGVVETMHLQQTRLHWAQIGTGAHRQLPSSAADFARDGSLLGVSFGPALTLWDTDLCSLKCSLTPPLQRNPVKTLRFGNHNVSHLIVTGTETELTCWNLVTLCRQWVVPISLSLLVSDPNSSYMCAFSKSRGLFIFDPASPQPELRLEQVCDSEVVAALFVAKANAPFLYFMTGGQELFCLGDVVKTAITAMDVAKFTPFSAQLAEKARRDVIAGEGLGRGAGVTARRFPASILDGPAHALPPVSLLCEDVLSGLLLTMRVSSQVAPAADKEEIQVIEAADRFQLATKIDELDLKKTVEQIFSARYVSGLALK